MNRNRALVLVLQGLALALWGLHLWVRRFPPTATAIPGPDSPETAWWGLWPITYAPGWFVWLGTALLAGVIVWGYSGASRKAADGASGSPASLSPLYFTLTALLIGAFFAFPLVHTRWGDAYMLANGLAWPDPALRITLSWQAPLDVFLHSRVWALLGEARHWPDAVPAYRLLSPIAGALYVAVALALAADRRLAPAWLTFGLLSTLGLIQLFFGYVENYSFAAAGVLLYLWLGMGAARGERPLWLAASVLAVTHATHPSTIVLAPSLLWLGWVRRRDAGGLVRNGLEIALPMLIVAGGTIALMTTGGHGLHALFTTDRPGGGDARWFVPLFRTETRWEQYTLLSWPHLRDWLNEQMLVAPVILPGLIVLGLAGSGRRRYAPENREADSLPLIRFLLIAAGAYLLFTWLWNPDYGGQRDWDLFSLAALPPTILLAVRLPAVLGKGHALWAGAMPLLVVQGLHTIAWIYQNTLPWSWP